MIFPAGTTCQLARDPESFNVDKLASPQIRPKPPKHFPPLTDPGRFIEARSRARIRETQGDDKSGRIPIALTTRFRALDT
jgi:hypothetical protein